MEQRKKVHLKVRIGSTPEYIYSLLSRDELRKMYWAEKTVEKNNQIEFFFPNGTSTKSTIIRKIKNRLFELNYFDSVVSFRLTELNKSHTVLEVINSEIPENDYCENYAGWVSVMLAMKAYVEFGVDLRNHDPLYSWDNGFIDN